MPDPEDLRAEGVVGVVHRPLGTPIAAAVITHGAGSNRDAVVLRLLAAELAVRGLLVARIDLPYRQTRPQGPPSPSGAATDRAGIVAAAQVVRDLAADAGCTGPLIVGGHSYGGRQASMVVAEDPSVADALLLTSYPLHPPGKPDRARTEHLPAIRCPTVVVHGPSDPFATTDEITAALDLIPGSTTLVEIPGTGHDLRPDRKPTAALTADAVLAHLLGRSG
ncbi:alpha/beta hydrolase family protein [Williamsia sp. MIQD14]|uniref:alpha/beta hydrolase family protein n=1 Tax=Williamsia sp. MIQD14 TaxID=3425703 RepID=UPI003DA0F79F